MKPTAKFNIKFRKNMDEIIRQANEKQPYIFITWNTRLYGKGEDFVYFVIQLIGETRRAWYKYLIPAEITKEAKTMRELRVKLIRHVEKFITEIHLHEGLKLKRDKLIKISPKDLTEDKLV